MREDRGSQRREATNGTTLDDVSLGLVGTKLTPPRLSRSHVSRPRLCSQLEACRDRALLLLRAPAGSGKSTLLAEWLTQHPGVCGWVSLDEHDNDLAGFLGYVLAAIRRACPGARLATRDLLQALTAPPLDALVASLIDDLTQLPDDLVLVLDDYHCIVNPEIHEFLQQLLRHPPERLHLVMATRAEPPLVAHANAGARPACRAALRRSPVHRARVGSLSAPTTGRCLRARFGHHIAR